MRTFTTVALGLLGVVVASASDVTSLTKDTFPDFVKANDLVLAECKSPSATAELNQYLTANIFLLRSLRSMSPLIPQVVVHY
jgi:hypothetical protein